MAALFYYSQG
jgi:hypothetical protein